MFAQLKLGTKFGLVIALVFGCGILATWLILSRVLERQMEMEVNARGQVLIETMNSVRNYTSTHINPLLRDELATVDTFISETVPAFSAREVFERLRQNPVYTNYFYKEATLNPTNERDLADPFERGIAEQFRADEALTQLSGFTTGADGISLYYSARPLRVGAESCLACHSTPDAAPASLISTFGTDGGFGWQLNEVVTAQMIYVPADDVIGRAREWVAIVMIIITAIFAIVVLVTNVLLRRMVVRPVGRIAAMAQKISGGGWTPDAAEVAAVGAIARRGDELGHTAQVFERMARDVYQREQRLEQEVKKLNIRIDAQKREHEVRQITDSEYFQDLQKKARTLRDTQSVPPAAIDPPEATG